MPKRRKHVPRREAETLKVTSLPEAGFHQTARRIASLTVVQGADIDLGRYTVCDQPITIGRDEEAELSLADGSMSRRHCRVERDDDTGRYVLIDLGSTNGTRVNGSRVHDKVPLAAGDKIFLGASVVRFGYADSVDLEYQSRLEEMVTTDPVTGMTSKRQYDALFAGMSEKASADGTPLAVMVMDLDGLKEINDTHGHEMGGFAIAEAAALIRDVLEPHGLLCRFGGDEFVASLPGVGHEHACGLAEEVRSRIAGHNFVKDGIRVEPTISIGVATFPQMGSPDRLFKAADEALYRAKRGGKNRVSS